MGIGLVLHTEQAHLRNIKSIDFIDILRIDTLDGDIDIRLTREQPYIAHHDIGEDDITDHQGIGSACLHRGQIGTKMALGISHGNGLKLVETDGDALTGIGCSPYGYFLTTLHDHARLKQLGQLYLGFRRKTKKEQKEKNGLLHLES